MGLLISTIGAIVAVVGWFGFKSVICLVIGVVAYAIESFMERNELQASAIALDVVIFIIGCIVGAFTRYPFYVLGLLFVNIYSLLMSVLGIIGLMLRKF